MKKPFGVAAYFFTNRYKDFHAGFPVVILRFNNHKQISFYFGMDIALLA
jgi:hypothetical protein